MKLFSLIYQGDVHPSSDEKIIPAESYSKLVDAEEVLQKAREDGETLLKETEKKCEELRKEAHQLGFQEGLEKLNDAIISLDLEQKRMRHELHRHILPIALTAAKKIVGKELEIFPETIVEIVLQTIAPVAQCQRIVIYVSKDEKAHLEAERPQIAAILTQVQSLTIQEKAGLTPGSCIIQTEKGMINATIENQWAALERAFQKYATTSGKE